MSLFGLGQRQMQGALSGMQRYEDLTKNRQQQNAQISKSNTQQTVGSTVGGAATGAMIGSMILPGPGTAIGAGIGGLAGYTSSSGDLSPLLLSGGGAGLAASLGKKTWMPKTVGKSFGLGLAADLVDGNKNDGPVAKGVKGVTGLGMVTDAFENGVHVDRLWKKSPVGFLLNLF